MLTYDLTKEAGPIYLALYNLIKQDIQSGKISAKEKMPSKRTLAKNLGVSIITIENAYRIYGVRYHKLKTKRKEGKL